MPLDAPAQPLHAGEHAWLAHTPAPACVLDTAGCVMVCNAAFARLLGLPASACIGRALPLGAAAPGGPENLAVVELVQATGREIPVIVQIGGEARGQRHCILTDISEFRSGELARRKADEQRLRLAQSVFEHTSEAIVITDAANNIVQVNSGFEAITGFSAEEVRGKNPRIFKSGRHDEDFYRRLWEALTLNGKWAGEIWDRRKDGELYPKWVQMNVVRDPASGEIVYHIAVFSDISEHKASEERIRHLAHHDPLTGLANRTALDLHLERALSAARRGHSSLCLLFIDLDHFKPVNDRYGHAVGDDLLVEVARRLVATIREADLAARLGGDEFVVLLEDMHRLDDTDRVAHALLAELAQPFVLHGLHLQVTPSIGVACFPRDGEDAGTLLKAADAAMYRAKARRSCIVHAGTGP